MPAFNKVLLGLVIILVVVLAVTVYSQQVGFEKPYWAVYLTSGDIYFGKITYFPRLSLTDVWFLVRNPQDGQNPLSIQKFDRALWGPEDRIYLNEKNIVWKAKLTKDSLILKFIESPQLPPQPIIRIQQSPTSSDRQ